MNKQQEILEAAKKTLMSFVGDTFNVFTVAKPRDVAEATNLAKIVSKLSPLVGNLIEFRAAQMLNEKRTDAAAGIWRRQDPGFPDVIYDGSVTPPPGLEIKGWYPLATEMTGRFKDSQARFAHDEIDLAILAWIPEHLFWGRPKIIDVCVVSAKSVAEIRDNHYHNPPHYLVLEPEDTTKRTANLRQTNTNGYVIQDASSRELAHASEVVASWGVDGTSYKTDAGYQKNLKQLQAAMKYRLDTNYAKIDRIGHPQIEEFKERVLSGEVFGKSLRQWTRAMVRQPEDSVKELLR